METTLWELLLSYAEAKDLGQLKEALQKGNLQATAKGISLFDIAEAMFSNDGKATPSKFVLMFDEPIVISEVKK